MSEYDFRSKCVAFECHGHGFAREVIVREMIVSRLKKVKLEARSAPWGHNLYSYWTDCDCVADGYVFNVRYVE